MAPAGFELAIMGLLGLFTLVMGGVAVGLIVMSLRREREAAEWREEDDRDEEEDWEDEQAGKEEP